VGRFEGQWMGKPRGYVLDTRRLYIESSVYNAAFSTAILFLPLYVDFKAVFKPFFPYLAPKRESLLSVMNI
jgi:hypothetical protein